MRRWRLFLLVLFSAALAAGVAFAGFRIYLGSDLAAFRFAARIGELYGATVQVDTLDVGMDGTAMRGVRFFEFGDLPGDGPWLVVSEIRTDLSLLNLAFDSSQVTQIDLDQPAITLRFNKDGRLLTRFPAQQMGEEPLPSLAIHRGSIHIQQEGQKEFVVNEIEATLALQKDVLVMNGTINDLFWGDWQTDGRFSFEKQVGELRLHNLGMHITQEKLRSLPFVAPHVWEEVQLEGDSPVDFTFRHDFPEDHTYYAVELHPVRTSVFVSAIDLQAVNAQGEVRVENGTVTLKNIRGQSADGAIETSAELSCRQEPKEMHFQIGVKHIDLRKLPNTWHLSRQINGRLDGAAELQVTAKNHRASTVGQGEGMVSEAHFAGLPVKDLRILLTADSDGFHFKPLLMSHPAITLGK